MQLTGMNEELCCLASARRGVGRRGSMSGKTIDVRRSILFQLVEQGFILTRARDWMTPDSRSLFGVSQKFTRLARKLDGASLELRNCEISNGQVVPSREFSEKLAQCVFELFALIGGLHLDEAFILKVLRIFDKVGSGEHTFGYRR